MELDGGIEITLGWSSAARLRCVRCFPLPITLNHELTYTRGRGCIHGVYWGCKQDTIMANIRPSSLFISCVFKRGGSVT